MLKRGPAKEGHVFSLSGGSLHHKDTVSDLSVKHTIKTFTFLTQWTLGLRLPLRCPSAWSVRQARTSSPLLSSAQHAPCSVPLLLPAHTTSLFQPARLIQEIPHTKIQQAAETTTLHHSSGPASRRLLLLSHFFLPWSTRAVPGHETPQLRCDQRCSASS